MRRGFRVAGRLLVAAVLLALAAGALLRPDARAPHVDGYYDAVAAELRARAPSRPIALIDRDRLDANLATVRLQLKPPQRLRLVTKSLPSLELIRYALERSGATGLMAFHAPFLPDLLRATAPQVDVLLGKPVSAAEAAEFYSALGPEEARAASERIQWLVSDVAMLDDYLALAAAHGLALRINLEIDVGLHRGGARNAFADMLVRYGALVAIARSEFTELVPADPTWNGGGWAADLVYPSGLATNPLLESPANENLLPTLSRLDGSPLQTLRTGDFVLYRPRQGDSLMQFETIYLLRGGHLAGAWRPFPRRL
jgi:D-serine deaminase-like pyridoxal phosphate-dependent protein